MELMMAFTKRYIYQVARLEEDPIASLNELIKYAEELKAILIRVQRSRDKDDNKLTSFLSPDHNEEEPCE